MYVFLATQDYVYKLALNGDYVVMLGGKVDMSRVERK